MTDSIFFGIEERDYFRWLPARNHSRRPESVINTIGSLDSPRRMGRKEASNFLKQFVLEQMRRARLAALSDE